MAAPSLPVVPRPTAHSHGSHMIRRYLFGMPAVLIALALIIPAVPAAAGGRKVALGVTIEHNNRQASSFDHFADQVNNRPRIWTIWSTWGNDNTKFFPTSTANWVAARGAVPMIFWEPFSGFNSCLYADHRQTARGDHDDYIRQWAQAAKAYNKPVIVRWAHEINGAFFPWGIKNTTCNDSIQDYKNAWRRIDDHLRQRGRQQRQVPLDDRPNRAAAAAATPTRTTTPATPTWTMSASATSTGVRTRTSGRRWLEACRRCHGLLQEVHEEAGHHRGERLQHGRRQQAPVDQSGYTSVYNR